LSVLGAMVTLTMLPETKGMSLKELNPEEAAGGSAKAVPAFSVQSRYVRVQRAGALAAISSAASSARCPGTTASGRTPSRP
jgi:hypothetical protein